MIRALAQVTEKTPYEIIGDVWTKLYNQCLTMPGMSEAQCHGLMGYGLNYFPPSCVEKPRFPWWGYIILGFFVGKWVL